MSTRPFAWLSVQRPNWVIRAAMPIVRADVVLAAGVAGIGDHLLSPTRWVAMITRISRDRQLIRSAVSRETGRSL
jgi:hypothetical protein